MNITVAELMERLEDYDPDAEVRIVTQPAWPLQFAVAGAVGVEDMAAGADEDDLDGVESDEKVVWLVAGDHPDGTPYGPKAAFGAV